MPPRFSMQSARSQWQTCLSQIARPLSSTARQAGLRDDLSSPGASVLGLDNDAGGSKRAAREPSDMYSSVMDHMRARKGITQARRQEQQMRTLQQLRDNQRSDAFLRQMPRRWAAGDVYAPHDLSPQEARKYRKAKAPRMDVMDALAINPVDEYRNFSIISEFMTPMGRIKHSRETGLRPVNQRKMARAIRRAIGLGIHPSVHAHPEILMIEQKNIAPPNAPTPTGARNKGQHFGLQV